MANCNTCGTGECRQPNMCAPQPRGVCEKRLEINKVPGACAQYSLYFDGQYQDSIDLEEAIKCAETDTEVVWNEKKCRYEYHNETYTKTKGTGLGLSIIDPKKIAGCISLCDLDGFCCDRDPQDCDLMVWKSSRDEDGCVQGCEGWQPYTPAETDGGTSFAVFDGNCLKKHTCPEDGTYQLTVVDGEITCDKVCKPKTIYGKLSDLVKGPTGAVGSGYFDVEANPKFGGAKTHDFGKTCFTNDQDCCMDWSMTFQATVCAISESSPWVFDMGVWACLTSDKDEEAGFAPNGSSSISTILGQSQGDDPTIGEKTVGGQVTYRGKIQPGETICIEYGAFITEVKGVATQAASTIGSIVGKQGQYEAIPPVISMVPCFEEEGSPETETGYLNPDTPAACIEKTNAPTNADGDIDTSGMSTAQWTQLYKQYAECVGVQTTGWTIYQDGSYVLSDGTTGSLPNTTSSN